MKRSHLSNLILITLLLLSSFSTFVFADGAFCGGAGEISTTITVDGTDVEACRKMAYSPDSGISVVVVKTVDGDQFIENPNGGKNLQCGQCGKTASYKGEPTGLPLINAAELSEYVFPTGSGCIAGGYECNCEYTGHCYRVGKATDGQGKCVAGNCEEPQIEMDGTETGDKGKDGKQKTEKTTPSSDPSAPCTASSANAHAGVGSNGYPACLYGDSMSFINGDKYEKKNGKWVCVSGSCCDPDGKNCKALEGKDPKCDKEKKCDGTETSSDGKSKENSDSAQSWEKSDKGTFADKASCEQSGYYKCETVGPCKDEKSCQYKRSANQFIVGKSDCETGGYTCSCSEPDQICTRNGFKTIDDCSAGKYSCTCTGENENTVCTRKGLTKAGCANLDYYCSCDGENCAYKASDCSKGEASTCSPGEWANFIACNEKGGKPEECQLYITKAQPRFIDPFEAFNRNRYLGLDYSASLEQFIKDQEISPWWGSWFRGDTMDALLTYTCSARSSMSDDSTDGVVLTSSTNGYASIEGEYFYVPELGEKPYQYKFTFTVMPECPTEFSVYVKTSSGSKIPLFKRNGAPAVFRANGTSDPRTWVPQHSDEELPAWKIISGRNQHPYICMHISKGSCFLDLGAGSGSFDICNDIVGSPYANTGQGAIGEDPASGGSDGSDSGSSGENGEVTVEDGL